MTGILAQNIWVAIGHSIAEEPVSVAIFQVT